MNMCPPPIIDFATPLVFATFRLSLLAISDLRRSSRSEFVAISTSLIDSPVAVKFVSSANSRGLVLFRQLGKSLI